MMRTSILSLLHRLFCWKRKMRGYILSTFNSSKWCGCTWATKPLPSFRQSSRNLISPYFALEGLWLLYWLAIDLWCRPKIYLLAHQHEVGDYVAYWARYGNRLNMYGKSQLSFTSHEMGQNIWCSFANSTGRCVEHSIEEHGHVSVVTITHIEPVYLQK